MKMKFEYNTSIIEFDVIFRKRKTMEIKIEPPDNVKVVAPRGISQDKIIDIVKSKAQWIIKKLDFYKNIDYKHIYKSLTDGGRLMLLGKYYPVSINISSDIKKVEIKLYNNEFFISAPDNTSDNSREKIRKSMELWYKKYGQIIIGQRIKIYQKYFDVIPNSYKVKQQKRRWGSCTYKNDLLFNYRCIMADEAVIDYIVVHEMCHMKHKDHSKNFWNLVEYILPDYKQRKLWLKENGFRMDF